MRGFYYTYILIELASAEGLAAPKICPQNIPTYVPTEIGVLDGEAFTGWISDEVGKGSRILALAQGQYHVVPGSQAHIFFSNLASVAIWIEYVSFTMTKVGLTAFNIYGCSGLVTLPPNYLVGHA